MTSSPAITPTTGADSIASFEENKDKVDEQDDKSPGINIIRPVDLSKITDAETHNAEKQGKHLPYGLCNRNIYRIFFKTLSRSCYMLHCYCRCRSCNAAIKNFTFRRDDVEVRVTS